jgi:hypothetical protein
VTTEIRTEDTTYNSNIISVPVGFYICQKYMQRHNLKNSNCPHPVTFKHMKHVLYKQDRYICTHQNKSISVHIIAQLFAL